jgi:hypothetical protein
VSELADGKAVGALTKCGAPVSEIPEGREGASASASARPDARSVSNPAVPFRCCRLVPAEAAAFDRSASLLPSSVAPASVRARPPSTHRLPKSSLPHSPERGDGLSLATGREVRVFVAVPVHSGSGAPPFRTSRKDISCRTSEPPNERHPRQLSTRAVLVRAPDGRFRDT